MRKPRFTDEQIVAIIRETDRDTVPDVAKREQSIYTWKKRFGVLQPDDMRRLKQFEQENARLKKLLEARSRNRGDEGHRCKNGERAGPPGAR